MAILESRLLPLIETLADAGADWLAFELMDGIRRGIDSEETKELLATTREQVRLGKLAKREPAEFTVALAKPILGDDQITWAAHYVAYRLDEALADLANSIDQLEAIGRSPPGQREFDAVSAAEIDAPIPLKILINDVAGHSVTRADVDQARAAMTKLRAALDDWSVQMTGAPPT